MMKIVLIELYIILVYEKFYFFIYLIIHGSKSSFMIVLLRFVLFMKENVEI